MSKEKKNNIRIEIKDDGKPHHSIFHDLSTLSKFKLSVPDLPDPHMQLPNISEWVNDHCPLVGDGDEAHGKATTKTRKQAKETTFRDLISGQNVSDPDELLKKMKDLIDGRKGKAVGLVLLRAYAIDKFLIRKPGRETMNEFNITGSWSGVHQFMDENDEYLMEEAKRIKIL